VERFPRRRAGSSRGRLGPVTLFASLHSALHRVCHVCGKKLILTGEQVLGRCVLHEKTKTPETKITLKETDVKGVYQYEPKGLK